jgi:hypothetical protein
LALVFSAGKCILPSRFLSVSGGILRKSDLLKAIQTEISKHDLDTFRHGSVVVPGCPTCKVRLNTVANFLDHLSKDVLPKLIDGLSSDAGAPPEEEYLDVDYWADPDRKIRRKSGEQDVIFTATSACSKVEWMMLLAGLGMVDPEHLEQT